MGKGGFIVVQNVVTGGTDILTCGGKVCHLTNRLARWRSIMVSVSVCVPVPLLPSIGDGITVLPARRPQPDHPGPTVLAAELQPRSDRAGIPSNLHNASAVVASSRPDYPSCVPHSKEWVTLGDGCWAGTCDRCWVSPSPLVFPVAVSVCCNCMDTTEEVDGCGPKSLLKIRRISIEDVDPCWE